MLKNEMMKGILVKGIKYAPTVFAVTCSTKILLLSMDQDESSAWDVSVNVVNWLLNVTGLGLFYVMGRYFGFCWKHRSLCRIALWGYAYYITILILDVPVVEVRALALLYLCSVMLITIMYKEIK